MMHARGGGTFSRRPGETCGEVKSRKQVEEETAELLTKGRQEYSVVQPVKVRVKPQWDARMLTTKSLGARVYGLEVTMDGWLKLQPEQGWALTHEHGADGVGKCFLRRCGEEPKFAVEGYYMQGLACLEVTFRFATVHSAPSLLAPQIGRRTQGEYVFARSQALADGWVRLVSPENGWMQVRCQFGVPLVPRCIVGADLWALSELWAVVRAARGSQTGGALDKETRDELKRVEELARCSAATLLREAEGKHEVEKLMANGLLISDDLKLPREWQLRVLFVAKLVDQLGESLLFKEVAPKFNPQRPPAPLPRPSEVIEIGGRPYSLLPDGVLVDEETQEAVAKWNHAAQMAEPLDNGDAEQLVKLSEDEVVLSDGTVRDLATNKLLGVINASTGDVEPLEELSGGEALPADLPGRVRAYRMHADDLLAAGRLDEAAQQLGLALEACEAMNEVDIELECSILHNRAECWERLENFERLLLDVRKLLWYDDEDPEALQWRTLALGRRRERPLDRAEQALGRAARARGRAERATPH